MTMKVDGFRTISLMIKGILYSAFDRHQEIETVRLLSRSVFHAVPYLGHGIESLIDITCDDEIITADRRKESPGKPWQHLSFCKDIYVPESYCFL